MQRETKTFTTKSGNVVVVKTYLTGREANSIKEEMYKQMTVDIDGKLEKGIPGALILEQEKKLLSVIVESIDGATENIFEKIENLRNDDYREIVDEVNKIYTGNLAVVK